MNLQLSLEKQWFEMIEHFETSFYIAVFLIVLIYAMRGQET